MTTSRLFDDIDDRIHLAREAGDSAYFFALTLKLEYITKLITSGVIACLGEDSDRQRYSLEYDLVRADSTGSWVRCLNTALTGQPARLFREGTQELVKDLTERVSGSDWRREAVMSLNEAVKIVGAPGADIGHKIALRQLFEIGVRLRNRSRGHGAPTIVQCGAACSYIAEACDAVIENLKLFNVPWAYLHRNWSKKYRVTSILNDTGPFNYLKSVRSVAIPNGVYLYSDQPIPIALVFTDRDVSDISLPNGTYKNKHFECLSYITNETIREDGSKWSDPPGSLPPSETEGSGVLDPVGNAFTNIPTMSSGYIRREEYEDRIRQELLTSERHPIVSLTGPGGIGKTTIAIAAIDQILKDDASPYHVILWISARDVDLLDWGPKPVSPKAVTQRDIAQVAVNLLEPTGASEQGFDSRKYFQQCLTDGAAGCTLFVFDNFETMEHPSDVYRWIDAHVRPPNKVLITTRVREFVGDYHIEIDGMNDAQAQRLTMEHGERMGIVDLLTADYVGAVIRESGGHPYVIKILLGELATAGRVAKPRRVVASNRDLLRALFERTYNSLSPGAQRVFVLLSSWRVSVPEIALEAVLLRPGTQRFDVVSALDELERYSLVDRVFGDDGKGFVSVSLAAAEYGKFKLDVSPFKVATEHDVKLLREFGIGKQGTHEDAKFGVFPRIENLLKIVTKRTAENPQTLESELPVLEFLAAQEPRAYLQLAELVVEVWDTKDGRERAKDYYRNFLAAPHGLDPRDAWLSLADLCQADKDVLGEIHALCETALLVIQDQFTLGKVINRLNGRVKRLKDDYVEEIRSAGVQELIERVCDRVWSVRQTLTATNASRLAWLCLNVGRVEAAREVAELGLTKEPNNVYCVRLMQGFEA